VPTIWTDTVEQHRDAVRDAVMQAAAGLVAERGVGAVTMSQVAERAGISRATLYRYFPDLQAVLVEWHAQHLRAHLTELRRGAEAATTAFERIEAALTSYALMARSQEHSEVVVALHSGDHAANAQHELIAFLTRLLSEGVAEGVVRSDVPPADLALYCLASLNAARGVSSQAAARRLVGVTLCGLQPNR